MRADFIPILLQILIACGFAALVLGLSVALGRSARRNRTKDSPYECGMLPIGAAQPRFSVKFYLIAMLFVLFDIEVVFLYPWAVQFQDLVARSPMAFWSGFGFIGILGVAYVYILRKGALDWNEA
jgi:NADH-quinone oxidoreductase subunit A